MIEKYYLIYVRRNMIRNLQDYSALEQLALKHDNDYLLYGVTTDKKLIKEFESSRNMEAFSITSGMYDFEDEKTSKYLLMSKKLKTIQNGNIVEVKCVITHYENDVMSIDSVLMRKHIYDYLMRLDIPFNILKDQNEIRRIILNSDNIIEPSDIQLDEVAILYNHNKELFYKEE